MSNASKTSFLFCSVVVFIESPRAALDLTWSGRRGILLFRSSCERILQRLSRAGIFRPSGERPSFPQSVAYPRSRLGSQPALDSPLAKNQLHRRHFDRIHRHSYNQQRAVRLETADQSRYRFPAGRGRKNHARTAEFLQFGRGIRGGGVDIEIRSKLFRKARIARPATYRGDAIAKFLCELNSQMAKLADSLNGDKVAWKRAAMTEGIECSNSGAHQRRGLGGIK